MRSFPDLENRGKCQKSFAKKIQTQKTSQTLFCFAKMYFLASREMLNEGSSRDTSEDGGSDSPSWRPSSQVPWVCVPQTQPWRVAARTQLHGQPANSWKISLQVCIKYTCSFWRTDYSGPISEVKLWLTLTLPGKAKAFYHQNCKGHSHISNGIVEQAKMYPSVQVWIHLNKDNHWGHIKFSS